jgi:hypothetical protein
LLGAGPAGARRAEARDALSDPPDWFERLTGFLERPYAQMQALLAVEVGALVSKLNGARVARDVPGRVAVQPAGDGEPRRHAGAAFDDASGLEPGQHYFLVPGAGVAGDGATGYDSNGLELPPSSPACP